mgnify:CR=1 FL=1
MRVVFADTGYWVALLSSNDDLHQKAKYLSRTLQPMHILTSEVVLTEVLNDFSKRGELFRDMAAQLITDLRSFKNVTIVSQTSEQFEQAFDLYNSRRDKQWSQTDCASFNIMQELGLSEALAYDKHFVQAGFVALMRNCQV